MDMTIGQKIRCARKMMGLTQQQAAERVGVSQMTIRRVEKNFRNPTVGTIKKVADAFGVSCSSLFADNQTESAPGRVVTLNEYQVAAARSINPALNTEQVLHHALHGLAGEVGEIHSLFQKAFQGHPLDPDHLKKETGDALWMIAEICTAMGWTLKDVARMNIDKLKARYPEGFSEDKSLHRKEGDI